MNEYEDLVARLQALGSGPASPEVSGRHLAAIEAAPEAGGGRSRSQRLRIVAAFAVGLLAGTSGLATAGALPDGAQEVGAPRLRCRWSEGAARRSLPGSGVRRGVQEPRAVRPVAAQGQAGRGRRLPLRQAELFPASPVIVDDDMFVTNLADAYTEAVGDEIEEDVRHYTVSHIKLP